MNRRIFIARVTQLLAAVVAVPAAITGGDLMYAKAALDAAPVPAPNFMLMSDELWFDLLKSDFDVNVAYDRSELRWLVMYGGKLQDGTTDWVAADYCYAEEDIEGTKANCLDAMWRRFKWINDPDRVDGGHV